jgi:hypothetical protein
MACAARQANPIALRLSNHYVRARLANGASRVQFILHWNVFQMSHIVWRMYQPEVPDAPIFDLPMWHPEGRFPLEHENTALYVRTFVEHYFAGRAGQEVWVALFGDGDRAAIIVEIERPFEMAGRYQVNMRRMVSVGCVMPDSRERHLLNLIPT